jgi:hypothetical protein
MVTLDEPLTEHDPSANQQDSEKVTDDELGL